VKSNKKSERITFSKIMRYLKKNYRQQLVYPSVHQVDVGYKYVKGKITNQLCIRFFVRKKQPRHLLKKIRIPKMVNGLPTDVITCNPKKHSREFRYDELIGGISIKNTTLDEKGTLGCILYDGNNQLVGLTNEHVLYDSHDRTGNDVVQPVEYRVRRTDLIGQVLKRNYDLDCAILSINTSRPVNIGFIEEFDGQIVRTVRPNRDMYLKKSGSTTEVTYGIIEGVSPNGEVRIRQYPNGNNAGGIIAAEGDSGSIWVLDDQYSDTAVALHYGGYNSNTMALAFDIRAVLSALNISFTKFQTT
jgi:hypothetical protein